MNASCRRKPASRIGLTAAAFSNPGFPLPAYNMPDRFRGNDDLIRASLTDSIRSNIIPAPGLQHAGAGFAGVTMYFFGNLFSDHCRARRV